MKYTIKSGFTLVELMVVIAIIGILAAALFPQMNQYLARSRDSARIQTAHKLSSFLVMYGVDFGDFPPVVEANRSGWDSDIDGNLLETLKNGGFQLTSPGESSKIWGSPSGQPNFEYYNYPVGWTNGCDDTRGNYYVLGIPNLEGWIAPSDQINRVGLGGSKEILSKSPGFWCKNEISNRDWGTEFEWVTGNYISGS